ncbi:hypothetical protein [Kribbella sindirgiensis]|uniref:Uncharacterized protein n=1 Tax=Kribbella sindirgiensis TaxID=1124744 RepID=A0A4R0IZ49_9ACTN|nr:hypothetical protein [Kribbella sindirgiensis]TCC39373.1 hypothetical protein E0H50_05410 [Kribbella sindirgiensis]
MTVYADKLGESEPIDGLVLLNYGDPAYRGTDDSGIGLSKAESIFLRLIGYLAFAEAVSIPARFMLEGQAMAQAMTWASPLLEEGLIVPERRSGPGSFVDLARFRQLPELGLRRAEYLDQHAKRARIFRFSELSSTYRDLLTADLAESGAFRRVVVGGRTGAIAAALSHARGDHEIHGDGNPETFVRIVEKHAPKLKHVAFRWAMARYYVTPLLYDGVNTREVPDSAARLLIKGGVLDKAIPPFEGAAPAEAAFERLKTAIPADSISSSARHYCEALLEVRRSLPEARQIFADIAEASHLKDAGQSLSHELDRELARQRGVRTGHARVFTLVSSLIGTAAGAAGGMPFDADPILLLLEGFGSGALSGIVSNEVQQKVHARADRKKRPWMLAMDQLDKSVSQPS